jgi:hypothetical protein
MGETALWHRLANYILADIAVDIRSPQDGSGRGNYQGESSIESLRDGGVIFVGRDLPPVNPLLVETERTQSVFL